jgi:hypothetical protein
MASEKQIAANRANAKKSTGPKTAGGKLKSSRNAFRHGLCGPLPPDPTTSAKVASIAGLLGDEQTHEDRLEPAADFARAQVELLRIRSIRAEQLAKTALNGGPDDDLRELKRLASLDRYERYALTKLRRAARQLRDRNDESSAVSFLPKRTQFLGPRPIGPKPLPRTAR